MPRARRVSSSSSSGAFCGPPSRASSRAAGPGFDVDSRLQPARDLLAAGPLWRPFGKRFLFDHHDLSPEMYAAKFGDSGALRGLRLLERMTSGAADVVITTNESHKQVAVERGSVPRQQTVCRPLGA